jgi:hypothetical protein
MKLKIVKINTGVDKQVMSGIGKFLKNSNSAIRAGAYGVKRRRK